MLFKSEVTGGETLERNLRYVVAVEWQRKRKEEPITKTPRIRIMFIVHDMLLFTTS